MEHSRQVPDFALAVVSAEGLSVSGFSAGVAKYLEYFAEVCM